MKSEEIATQLDEFANEQDVKALRSTGAMGTGYRNEASLLRLAAARLRGSEELAVHLDKTVEVAADAVARAALAEARARSLEIALDGLFRRLDHPGNGGQHVNYFLRWPEVAAARALLPAPPAGEGQ